MRASFQSLLALPLLYAWVADLICKKKKKNNKKTLFNTVVKE